MKFCITMDKRYDKCLIKFYKMKYMAICFWTSAFLFQLLVCLSKTSFNSIFIWLKLIKWTWSVWCRDRFLRIFTVGFTVLEPSCSGQKQEKRYCDNTKKPVMPPNRPGQNYLNYYHGRKCQRPNRYFYFYLISFFFLKNLHICYLPILIFL